MITDYFDSIFPSNRDVSGYVTVGTPEENSWKGKFFSWPTQRAELVEYCNINKDNNVYIVPSLYGELGIREAANISHQWVACVDSDLMDISQLRITPTAVVRTSQGRHQVYWRCAESNPTELAKVSKAIAQEHAKDGHDISCWDPNHFFRVPGTTNKRRDTRAELVTLTDVTYTLGELTEAYPVA